MTKKYFNINIFILLLFGGIGSISNAALISQGTTYQIVEPDLLLEIEQKAKQVNWQKLQKNTTLTQMFAHLPMATADTSYYHTPVARLPFEVKDNHGKILYPKGFKFNPLKYTTLPNQLIVLGAVHHLKRVSMRSNLVSLDDTLLISNMDTRVFIKQTGRQAFLLTQEAVSRLGVKRVPCVVSQKGDRLLIQEYAPRTKKPLIQEHTSQSEKRLIKTQTPRGNK